MDRKRIACVALSFLMLGGCLSAAISSSFAHRDNVQYLQMAIPAANQISTLTSNYLVVGGQNVVLEWPEAEQKEDTSTDGADTIDPTESTNPTEGTTEPTAPTNPTEGTTEPTVPTDPTEGTTEPTAPTNPTEGTTEPTAPTDPTEGTIDPTESKDLSQNVDAQSLDESTGDNTNDSPAMDTTSDGNEETPTDDTVGENGETSTDPIPGETEEEAKTPRLIYVEISLTASQDAVSGVLSVSSENLTALLGKGDGGESKPELLLTISAGETVSILLIIIEETETEALEIDPTVELVWISDDGTIMSATFLLREPEKVAVPEDITGNFAPIEVAAQCAEGMPLALKFTDNWELTLLWQNGEQTEETAGKFPAGTRYYIDGRWTMLDDAGVIHCQGEDGGCMLLDIPQSPENNTLYALAALDGGEADSSIVARQNVTYVQRQQSQTAPIILAANAPLTLENWQGLDCTYSLSRLEKTQTGIDWVGIDTELEVIRSVDELKLQIMSGARPQAGTYRLDMVWRFGECEVKRTQTVFYILYPNLNGGATP